MHCNLDWISCCSFCKNGKRQKGFANIEKYAHRWRCTYFRHYRHEWGGIFGSVFATALYAAVTAGVTFLGRAVSSGGQNEKH